MTVYVRAVFQALCLFQTWRVHFAVAHIESSEWAMDEASLFVHSSS